MNEVFIQTLFIRCLISLIFRTPEAFLMIKILCVGIKDSLQQFVTTCGLDHISRAILSSLDLTDLDFVFIILSTTHIPQILKHSKISVSHFLKNPRCHKKCNIFYSKMKDCVYAYCTTHTTSFHQENTFHPICINRRLMSLDNLSVLTHAGRTKKY